MSETVARTGWPASPNGSQKRTGKPWWTKPSSSSMATRSATLALPPPGCEMPERSPFTSDRKQGTPMAEKRSASTCRVTVLPVPVAPVISPWRLAICGSRTIWCSPDFAMRSGWVILHLFGDLARTL